jgi:protocatechuate 3,4-dioxygenase beta subunit
MRARLRRGTIVVGFVALTSAIAAAQVVQQPAPQALVKGTGLMVGQIVDAASMKGIPGAVVTVSGGPGPTSASPVVLPTGEVITAATGQNPRQVIADSSGRFMFRDLAAGSYTVRATSAGFIPGIYGQNRPNGVSQPVVLDRDDEKRGGLAVRLWRSATVAGRLIDELGDPIVGTNVRLLRRTMVNGRPRLATGASVQTDDRGMYRFSGVVPGEYVVGVLSSATTLPASFVDTYLQMASSGSTTELINEVSMSGAPFPSTSGIRVGELIVQTEGGRMGGPPIPPPSEDGRMMLYSAQFYPNASVIPQATVLNLQSGDERSDVDMQMRLRRTQRVSGTVSGPDGPLKHVGVRLMPAGAEELGLGGSTFTAIDAGSTVTDASGNFTFLGIAPGAYSLQVVRVPRTVPPRSASSTTTIEMASGAGMIMMSSGGPLTAPLLPLPTDPTLWGGATVNVGEADVNNVSVVLRTGARLSGKIVFEGNGTPPPPDILQRTGIQMTSLTGSLPSPVAGAQKRVETDGRFATVGYPPGRYSVSASIPVQPQAKDATVWRFRSATLNGRDLADEGLEIEQTDIAGLVLTFTDKSTEVSGTVTDLANQPDASALVVVIPADSQAWRQSIVTPRRVRSVRTGTGGSYTFRDLPPGEYFIGAVSDAAVSNWSDPRTLEAISRVSQRITVTDGGTISQRLTTAAIR